MRTLSIMKITLKSFFMQYKSMFLSFCLLPFVLVSIYSFTYGDLKTSSQALIPDIYMEIIDQDQSELSARLTEQLHTAPFIAASGNPTYVVHIPAGFETDIVSGTPVILTVEEGRATTVSTERIFRAVVEQFGELWHDTYLIEQAGEITDKEAFLTAAYHIDAGGSISNSYIEPEQTLNSFEQQAFALSPLIFFMLLSSLGASIYKQEKTGRAHRYHVMPISKTGLYHNELTEGFVFSFLAFLAGHLMFAIRGPVFREQFGIILVVILLQSMLCAALGPLMADLLPENLSMSLITIFSLLTVFSSSLDVLGPIQPYLPSTALKTLYDAAAAGNISLLAGGGTAILIICLLSYAVTRLRIYLNWRRY